MPSRSASLPRLQVRPLTPKRWPELVIPDAFAWTGTAAAFRRAGFVEVLRRSATRPIMRFVVGGESR